MSSIDRKDSDTLNYGQARFGVEFFTDKAVHTAAFCGIYVTAPATLAAGTVLHGVASTYIGEALPVGLHPLHGESICISAGAGYILKEKP